jgi:hypothetical protein
MEGRRAMLEIHLYYSVWVFWCMFFVTITKYLRLGTCEIKEFISFTVLEVRGPNIVLSPVASGTLTPPPSGKGHHSDRNECDRERSHGDTGSKSKWEGSVW